jgi:hypothetical protein
MARLPPLPIYANVDIAIFESYSPSGGVNVMMQDIEVSTFLEGRDRYDTTNLATEFSGTFSLGTCRSGHPQ